ncbi:MAG TPA: restriction endonuclease subunit R [Kocuria sp.]|nr:DEAD/DEAH box helicase family protein [Kocuria rhizophila]HBH55889.1 restriction endonuclease subunit R [Kocuria sp.]
MSNGFLDASLLEAGGPHNFTRQIQRLLPLLGFVDVVNIDGSGDKGGDIIGRLEYADWVFQAKWKMKGGTVSETAVDEVVNAMRAYGIDRGVVVTNGQFTRGARDRVATILRANVQVSLWDINHLVTLSAAAATMVKQFTLHEYQQRAVSSAWASLEDEGRALVYLATGLGKTVVAGRLVTKFLIKQPRARVLVIAHTSDLVEQLERSMWRDIPKEVPTRIVSGQVKPDDLPGVTFAVLPTAARYVSEGFKPDFLIVDEAHHVGETGHYAEIFGKLPDVPRLGVTATPWRGDQFDIESVFGEPVATVSISEGMRLGYLAGVHYRLFSDNIDWEFVHEASEHDYSIKDLNKRLFIPERDEAIRDHLLSVWDQVVNPRAIVFCQTIRHAEAMAETLSRVPGWGSTQAVHGGLKKRERRSRILDFRAGNSPILTSVDLLNEGVDVPDVNILVFARVTHSRRIFVQQLGRGLRLADDKEVVEVLDFISDVRRLAEVQKLSEQVGTDDLEQVSVPRNSFEFTDDKVHDLLQQWIHDVGDLGAAEDTVRLEFPPFEVG